MPLKSEYLADNAAIVAGTLKVLSNPQRLIILCVLADSELTVSDMNARVPLSQSALSQHLALLRQNEMVCTRREAQTIFYRIADPRIKELLAVLHDKFCANTLAVSISNNNQ